MIRLQRNFCLMDRCVFTVVVATAALLFCPADGQAQTDPSNFTTVINIPTDPDIGDGRSIGSDTQLNLSDGGTVGIGFQAGAPDGSATNVEMNIFGGEMGPSFGANAGSTVNVLGGVVEQAFRFRDGSAVNIAGGIIVAGEGHRIHDGSTVTMTGGSIVAGVSTRDANFILSGGSVDAFNGGANTTIIGSEFQLNGTPFSSPSITLVASDVLTGTLADGSSFIFGRETERLTGVSLSNVSLSAPNISPITVANASDTAPQGLRAGQLLTLSNDGALPSNFAVVDATLNIQGGTSYGLEVSRSTVSISGGVNSFDRRLGGGIKIYAGGALNVSGGELRGRINAFSGSLIQVSGGEVGSLHLATNSILNFSGGKSDFIRGENGSTTRMTGGIVKSFDLETGGAAIFSGGRLGPSGQNDSEGVFQFHGGEFLLNGSQITGSFASINLDDVITGTLEDGTPFILAGTTDRFLRSGQNTAEFSETSTPAINFTPIVVDGTTPEPKGLRAGQSLTLENGGALGEYFAVINGTLQINGGAVGEGLEVAGSQVNITGGTIGNFVAHAGSTVNISGGDTLDVLAVGGSTVNISGGSMDKVEPSHGGSSINITGGIVNAAWARPFDGGGVINITGGNVGGLGGVLAENSGNTVNISGDAIVPRVSVTAGGTLNILAGNIGSLTVGGFGSGSGALNMSGGEVGDNAQMTSGLVNLSGGSIGDAFLIRRGELDMSGGMIGNLFRVNLGVVVNMSGGIIGDGFSVANGGSLNLFGTEFLIDGIAIPGLSRGELLTITDRDVILSGSLMDGTAFSFDLDSSDFDPNATLTVTLSVIPEPSTALLGMLGLGSLLGFSRKR